jgi:surface polysaccharide O-acyltransferase-like enzyme
MFLLNEFIQNKGYQKKFINKTIPDNLWYSYHKVTVIWAFIMTCIMKNTINYFKYSRLEVIFR